ncbi:sensor histidine kinase KdpD [Apibacter sp. HY039]|uniref:sensor histidine kinase n=1 Tax=Apibacter sp. HY039 TaxID=2501476 RepID=UPI000FEB92B7|nr:HAMP domain-containing sensor histidine kinase [Apibacter sp. HY039]
MRLHNYTLKYLTIALLLVISLWAALFYAFILDEVYDNIDDGLKNSKIEIIKEAYKDPKILNTREFGINNFRITPMPEGDYPSKSKIITTQEYLEFDDEDEPVRLLTAYFYDSDNNPYKLEVKTSMIEEDDLLADLSIALLVLYLVLIISIFLLNYILLKKVWKSFYDLLNKLKKYIPGNKSSFTSTQTKIKEFKDLENEIEKMMIRNENSFNQQKLFISNAAHELQTPLAISINKLELLAEDPQITEKQLEGISSITNSLNRLVNLNKSLLLLTRIENNQFHENENISFNDIIKNSLTDFTDFAEYKQISIELTEIGNFEFYMNKGLAITLINNLIKNAIIHNYPTGKIIITISQDYFLIQNTSIQTVLDEQLIFNRFYRNSNDSQSTGLGLSLVKTIINSYPKLSIQYTFNDFHSFKIYQII